jgi:hypothetical protein
MHRGAVARHLLAGMPFETVCFDFCLELRGGDQYKKVDPDGEIESEGSGQGCLGQGQGTNLEVV